ILAMFKINILHWHLTDDQLWTVEIKKYPKLTEIGSNRLEGEGTYHSGFYTQEDLKDVVAYASERFVEIIPEIEMPGHGLAALTAYPEFSCTGGPFAIRNVWGVEPDVFCAGKEETFKFLEDVLTEIIPIFPSEYIHIGGDECPKDRWNVCPKCKARMQAEGLKDSHELQSYFVKRMEKFINSKGKKIIGWDEILEGGAAPNATIMSWRGEAGGIAAANADHDVIMTPNTYVYLDYYQGSPSVEPMAIGGYLPLEKTYSFNPTPKDIAEDKAHRVIGVQGNVWAEYLYEPSAKEYMAYPRMLAVAETGWSPNDKKDLADFSRRLNNAYVRMDAYGVNYHIPLPEGVATKYVAFIDSTKLEFTNTGSYPMVYTITGNDPTANSTIYKEPLAFTDNATVKIATLLPSGKLSAITTYTVAKETLAPAVDVATTPGFNKKTVDGHFLNREAYSKATFSDPVVITEFTKAGEFDYKKPSVEIYDGYFTVAEDGIYTIATDNVELYVDDQLLIDNDGKVSRNLTSRTTKALAAGKHKFSMVMNNSVFGGWPYSWSLNTFYLKAPSAEKLTAVTSDMLSH
ncbi:MAG: family 20 glycosylhydrolase, partial [Rikenellaceae bacterium]